jgi:hypothetical protein
MMRSWRPLPAKPYRWPTDGFNPVLPHASTSTGKAYATLSAEPGQISGDPGRIPLIQENGPHCFIKLLCPVIQEN